MVALSLLEPLFMGSTQARSVETKQGRRSVPPICCADRECERAHTLFPSLAGGRGTLDGLLPQPWKSSCLWRCQRVRATICVARLQVQYEGGTATDWAEACWTSLVKAARPSVNLVAFPGLSRTSIGAAPGSGSCCAMLGGSEVKRSHQRCFATSRIHRTR